MGWALAIVSRSHSARQARERVGEIAKFAEHLTLAGRPDAEFTEMRCSFGSATTHVFEGFNLEEVELL